MNEPNVVGLCCYRPDTDSFWC